MADTVPCPKCGNYVSDDAAEQIAEEMECFGVDCHACGLRLLDADDEEEG